MNTPPDTCPVCLKVVERTWTDPAEARYQCGAVWIEGDWHKPCPHAMTAALRVGATLHPTAREQARDALVAAAVEYKNANDALYAQALEVRGNDGTYDRVNAAYTALLDTTDAYLALEPRP